MSTLLDIWPALLLIIVLSVFCAALLRFARAPGARVVGGLLAGFLLGPSILGVALPQQYERWFLGGVEQAAALDQLQSRQTADETALQSAGADDEAIAANALKNQADIDAARAAVEAARWDYQAPIRWLTAICTALMLLGAGALPVSRTAPSTPGAVFSIGLGQALLPGGIVFFLAYFAWDDSVGLAMIVAAAAGIGPWALGDVDREAADQAEYHGARLVQSAGRLAGVLGIGAALLAAQRLGGWTAAAWLTPLLGLPVGWRVVPAIGRIARDWFPPILDHGLIPIVACCATVPINLFEEASVWPAIVLLLVSADGRWLGAFIGAILPGGRRALPSMRLVIGSMAAGPTQLAIAALATHARIIPGEMTLALALGALIIEITTPARRRMARRIMEIEDELHRINEEDQL